MEFRILGPLEVLDDDGAIALRGAKPRALMAVLLLNANEPVSSERLAVALWGEDAPASAAKTVQVHVSRLRKSLGDSDVLTTTPAGYRLRVLPGELDAERFAELVEEGRRELRSGHPERASAALRDGLALWRGPPLADLEFEAFAQPEISRLEEQRLVALEARADAELAAGRHVALVGELQRLARLHPSRERFAGQLMLALYRSDRQTEALEAYRDARQALVETSGIEPGPELRRLHEAILRQDPALRLPPSSELPPELDASRAPALAGREAEVAALLDCWEQARGGHGVMVTVSGEHGIGKTRLAMELAAEVHRLGALVLYASGLGAADGVDWVIAQAREADSPLLLVLDDVDRAGPAVHAELRGLAAAVGALPVMVLAVGRDVERVAPAGEVRIALGPLGLEAVAAIAASYARDQPDEDVPVEWLFERSGGAPLRIHEAASEWASAEAERRIGAVAGRAAEGRAQLRSMEAELAGGIVDLQVARERAASIARPETQVICPFKGLAAFDTDDAEYYFGRERLVAELVARIVGAPLLGIVGPSGSGKSSVLRAGLLPALAAGVLPGSETWEQVIIRPGEHPLRELNRAGAAISDQSRLVLAVDQFEETFTACDDDAEREAFVGSLVHAARDTRGRCIVVLAIRADQYERCAAFPALSGLLAANHVLVTPMQREELRDVVERPAQRVGLVVEPGLTDALVAHVEGEPGALPLLSTALLELWQQRDGRRLHRAAYERSGGVRGAVGRLAEEAYAQLDPRQQEIARSALVRLAAEGAGGTVERRRVPLAELETEQSEEAARLIELFTDRRLLTVTAGSVEVAHEALLREWPRLRGWIEEDREGLRIHRAVTAAADEWQRLDRDDGALYRGSRLAEATEWRASQAPTLNELEREFLDTSKGRRDRERAARRRWIEVAFAGLAVALAAITAVAIVAISQGNEAEQQRDIAVSQQLAATSTNSLDADPAASVRLALRALDSAPTEAAAVALRQATLQSRTLAILHGHQGRVQSASFSPDGHRAVSSGEDGTVRIWDLDAERLLRTVPGHKGLVYQTVFAPDGAHIASAGADGTVAVMNADGSARRIVHRGRAAMQAVDFAPDGDRLAVGSFDGSISVVSLSGGTPKRELGRQGPVATIRFNRDATQILASDLGGQLRLWDVSAGTSRVLLSRPGISVVRAGITRDGRTILSGWFDGRIVLQDAKSGKPTATFKDPSGGLFGAAISPDGQRVVSGGPNGTLNLWDVPSRTHVAALRGHENDVIDVRFSPNGDRLISAGGDGTVRVWQPPGQRVFRAVDDVYGAAASGDARRIVDWGDGGLEVLDTADGTVARLAAGPVSAAAISQDGRRVLGGDSQYVVRLWPAAGGPPQLSLRGHKAQINGVAFGSVAARAVSGADDEKVIVWNLIDRQPVATLDHGDAINAVGVSPDGARVLSAGQDGVVRIWRADRAADPVAELRAGGGDINAAAFSPNGRRVVAGLDDGTVRVWNVSGGNPQVLHGHVGQVTAVAFNGDGSLIASGGGDGQVRIWNGATGRPIVVIAQHPGGDVVSVGFTTDGSVLSAGIDDTIRISACEVCGPLADTVALADARLVR